VFYVQAVWALGNVAGDSPQLRDMVLKHNALLALLLQLNEHTKLSMLRNATWTLSNFCRGKPQPNFEQVCFSSRLNTSECDAHFISNEKDILMAPLFFPLQDIYTSTVPLKYITVIGRYFSWSLGKTKQEGGNELYIIFPIHWYGELDTIILFFFGCPLVL
jgi:Armadillo/beta-catenin-like repeat